MQFSTVPADVVRIVLQHHENCLGTGFPNRLTATQIYPLAKVVSAANRFCELVLPGPVYRQHEPKAALQLMADSKEFDAGVLAALKQILDGLPS